MEVPYNRIPYLTVQRGAASRAAPRPLGSQDFGFRIPYFAHLFFLYHFLLFSFVVVGMIGYRSTLLRDDPPLLTFYAP